MNANKSLHPKKVILPRTKYSFNGFYYGNMK